ncbi:hypothetical protein ACKC5O_16905 [Aeromonas schubertii]|uniref:Uncharacterized protein n=1 Tax=Aeromonas schubertii TaxID=652 RepID=A0A0S2SQ18_9GAMM|nr:hypothetical protein [Aeromonas schubertii]ALP43737.1 hypothetical protein WL1483_4318 [Aeromonas schubertii]KUE81289.1 hypothetical protein ATO46_12380 [Aeromonas schubertii]MBZ6067870.1 hypothetical protein [Aeromonas schubertii]MBZ6073071.1 hypothetical protein [Aeromonas schubertii]QCG47851.1 hypothetical protein E2P79_08355 [Aeromonas schubertii]
MTRHNQYRITFFDRHGMSNQIELSTPYLIMRDSQCDLCLFDLDHCIGSEETIEHMIRQKTGVDEEISIISASPL